MDVGGNNIANGNTAGFRSAQITFGEAMAQTLQGPPVQVSNPVVPTLSRLDWVSR
jgi:flagellar hook protein FlgE